MATSCSAWPRGRSSRRSSQRHDSTTVLGLFAFVNGVISIGIMAAVALVTGAPFIFPSLGPTAFLLFYTPTLPAVVAAQQH